MRVAQHTVVTVEFKLADAQGEVIQDSSEMTYLHGGYDEVFGAIEQVLEGTVPDDEAYVQIEPEDAFGEYDPDLIRIENRDKFPEMLEVGMQFEGIAGDDVDKDESIPEEVIWTVTNIAEDKVVLDGNHPLAGIALRYYLCVKAVRPATAEELELGTCQTDEAPFVQIAKPLH
ncbi:MAG: peptidylprolyl isomerase [Burkholderiaceae bacterium]